MGTHEFEFPTEPGLYNLTGKNLNNPRLEANGVGKSTLLEAIHWCFYGHTSRGLKAGEVVTWSKRTCKVTVEAIIGKDTVIIERVQAPNSLTLNGKSIVQGDVTKLLRLSPEQFALAVMLPQFGDSFLDLKPTAKLALFSQIMELDFWLEKSKAADVLAKELQQAKTVEENRLAKISGQMEAYTHDCKNLEAQKAEFRGRQDNEIRNLSKSLRQCSDDRQSITNDIMGAQAGLKRAIAAEEEINKTIKANHNEIDITISERQKLATKAAVLESTLETHRANLKKLSGLGSKCPTCRQNVDTRHLRAEKAQLQTQIDTTEAALAVFEKGMTKLADQRAVIAKASSSRHEELSTVARNKTDFSTKIIVLQSKIEHNILEQEQLENQIKLEKKRENPYTQMLVDKRAALADLKAKRAECKAQIMTLNEDHAAVSYWVQGFKRVRLFLIEETLRDLELEVNNSLTSLGLLDWHIEFDVERENKSGGLTKGFVVLIHAPGAPGPVRWEAWSGGETQRLKLAGDLGLANLIMERAGLTGTIEFFDEPSKHMSPQGLLDLAETLHQRALTTEKRIFIVDHHAIDFGDFNGTITVIKDQKGSRIEYA